MDKFQLPVDGSVLIIDDKKEEAWPLIQFLSSQGVATRYYSGTRDEEYPAETLQKVRLAFLDIQLLPGLSEHNYAQIIKQKLDLLISGTNGPYIAVLWSQKEDLYAEAVETVLLDPGFEKKPVIVLRLKKTDFFKTTYEDHPLKEDLFEEIDDKLKSGFNKKQIERIKSVLDKKLTFLNPDEKIFKKDAPEKISNKLSEKLKEANAFHLFTIWENLVNKASGKIVDSFSSLHATKQFWDTNFKYSIYRMAEAQLGSTIESAGEQDLINSALKTLNATLLDEIGNIVSEESELSKTVSISQNQILYAKMIGARKFEVKLVPENGRYELFVDGILQPGKQLVLEKLHTKASKIIQKDDIEKIVSEIETIVQGINARLLFNFSGIDGKKPGTVFLLNYRINTKLKILNSYFDKILIFKKDQKNGYQLTEDKKGKPKKDQLTEDKLKTILFVDVEVSPPCDFAQEKRQRLRFLSGILVPDVFIKNGLTWPDSSYKTLPVIEIGNESYRPLFDFRSLHSVDIIDNSYSNKKVLFSLREEVFADMLSRLSSHASRVGISCLG